jgi:hypothetical protein
MYIELKTHQGGHDDLGPARIGRVTFSKTGRTIYYRNQKFQRAAGLRTCGNHFDCDTEDVYWISGCKKNGQDRLWGGAPVEIDDDVREEYWTDIRNQPAKVNRKFS